MYTADFDKMTDRLDRLDRARKWLADGGVLEIDFALLSAVTGIHESELDKLSVGDFIKVVGAYSEDITKMLDSIGELEDYID